MKKLLATLVFSMLYVTSVSADMGVNVGVSGNAGILLRLLMKQLMVKRTMLLSMVQLAGDLFSQN